MEYELYIDVFFLTNFVMDYLLLMIVRKALSLHASQKRVCAAALSGAFGACIVISIPMPSVCRFILFHVLVNTKMTGILMKTRKLTEIWKGILVLYLSAFLLGGIFVSISQFAGGYTRIGSLFLGSAILCYTGISWGVDFLKKLWKLGTVFCNVTLCVNGKMLTVPAMIDSGNSLKDDLTGKPVHIISKKSNEKIDKCKSYSKNTLYSIPHSTKR